MIYDDVHDLYKFECQTDLTAGFYSAVNSSVDNSYPFRFFDTASGANPTRVVWDHVEIDRSDYGVVIENGYWHDDNRLRQDAYVHLKSAANSDYGNRVTIYYDPSLNRVYALPNYTKNYIYLSDGFVSGLNSMDVVAEHSNDFTSVSAFDTSYVTTNISSSTDSSAETHLRAGSNATLSESYVMRTYTATDSDSDITFKVQTTLSSDLITVTAFNILNLKTFEITSITPKDTDKFTVAGNVYSAVITAPTADLYVVPVIDFTDAYITANYGAVRSTPVEFKMNSIKWGGLVSLYTFKTSPKTEPNGNWPGSLMWYDSTENKYKGIAYKSVSNTNDGIVFTNFNVSGSNVTTIVAKYAHQYNYPDSAQTYDYYEPVALASDDSILTFGMKSNNDGYHGDNIFGTYNGGPYHLDDNNQGEGENKTNQTWLGHAYNFYDSVLEKNISLIDDYTFEYLTDVGGTERLSLDGTHVQSASAGFYVIAKGDRDYANTWTFDPDTSYKGEYSVDWYIYDANFKYLGKVLSASMYKKNASTGVPYVIDYLRSQVTTDNEFTESEIADMEYAFEHKSVMISYEAPNTRGTTTRYSGQWYTTPVNSYITVNAVVGMYDASTDKFYVPESSTSRTSYGQVTTLSTAGSTAAINCAAGDDPLWATVLVNDAKTNSSTNIHITLTAASSNFVGWYKYDKSTDTYSVVSDSSITTIYPSFTTDSTYYAMYRPVVSYVYEYYGRTGIKRSIDVQGIGLNGVWGETAGTVNIGNEYRRADITAKFSGEGNQVKSTFGIFHKDVNINFSAISVKGQVVTIPCTSTYTVGNLAIYKSGGESLVTISGITYGIVIDFSTNDATRSYYTDTVLPEFTAGNFKGWYEYTPGTGTIGRLISSSPLFGIAYNYAGNMNIIEVRNGTSTPTYPYTWNPYVEENVVTHEANVIFDDFALGYYHQTKGTVSRTIKDVDGNFGVLMVVSNGDSAVQENASALLNSIVGGSADEKYLTYARGKMSAGQTAVAKISGESYSPTGYSTRLIVANGVSLSNFNRADLVVQFDGSTYSGYTAYAVAYAYVDGQYYFSTPVAARTL